MRKTGCSSVQDRLISRPDRQKGGYGQAVALASAIALSRNNALTTVASFTSAAWGFGHSNCVCRCDAACVQQPCPGCGCSPSGDGPLVSVTINRACGTYIISL